jgi:hypothetical protein
LTPSCSLFGFLTVCIMKTSVRIVKTDWSITNLVCYGGICDGHYTHFDAVNWGFKDFEIYFIFSCVGEDIGFKTVPGTFSVNFRDYMFLYLVNIDKRIKLLI